MNRTKPFLMGLGIGIIVATIVVQVSVWISNVTGLQLPIPSASPGDLTMNLQEPITSPKVAPNVTPSKTVGKSEDVQQMTLLRLRVERLQSQIAKQQEIRIYIPELVTNWQLISLLKGSGILKIQKPFEDLYPSGFVPKSGVYQFKQNADATEVLFKLGVPVVTATPLTVQTSAKP